MVWILSFLTRISQTAWQDMFIRLSRMLIQVAYKIEQFEQNLLIHFFSKQFGWLYFEKSAYLFLNFHLFVTKTQWIVNDTYKRFIKRINFRCWSSKGRDKFRYFFQTSLLFLKHTIVLCYILIDAGNNKQLNKTLKYQRFSIFKIR